MPELKLYLSERNSELNKEVRDYLETFWLNYTESITDYERPKLEVKRNGDKEETYRGLTEIKEGLKELDIDDFEKRF